MNSSTTIRLFTLGVHRGEEIDIFLDHIVPRVTFDNWEVWGFEAGRDNFVILNKKYKNKRIHIFHVAIWDKVTKLKLYHAKTTYGHSVYPGKYNVISKDNYEVVDTLVFSEFIKEFDLNNSFNLLHYNMEGAELNLFRDMDKNDCFKYFDIICGNGHDLPNVTETKDSIQEFNEINNKHGLQQIPFKFKDYDFTYNRIVNKLCH